MSLSISAILTCDKDLITTAVWADIYTALPTGWQQVVGAMDIAAVNAYFCPTCIALYGTRQLFKDACDLSMGLTDAP